MNKKYFLCSFIVSTVVLFCTSFVANEVVNQDQDYISKYPSINPKEFHKERNFVVVIISSDCPGAPSFMPILKKNIELLKKQGFKYYVVNDNSISEASDLNLTKCLTKYDLNETAYFIDSKEYPETGGFINAKKRYKNFVHDIIPNPEQPFWGYAYYIIYKDGKYYKDTYEFKAEYLM